MCVKLYTSHTSNILVRQNFPKKFNNYAKICHFLSNFRPILQQL